MKKILLLLPAKVLTTAGFFCTCCALLAQSPGSPFIRLDQFGYRPDSKKVAVIADPVTGFDATQSFTPGNVYEVRRVSDGQSVFSGAPVSWKNGATHIQSGDKGWWFDFSAVTTPGDYYLHDVVKNVSSHPFKIGDDVYRDVLKQAVRTYFYQRLNFAKQPPYTDAKWADGAAYEGADQDKTARSRWDKTNPATARDVHGGWMDAGDVNKYTTFAEGAVLQLLEAYRRNPSAFTDDFNIPESGNGIPDLLDELIWELDFLKRMQDATGTDGFLLKVGVDNYNDVSPPSADTRPRYYLPECTSATLAGCAMFAQAGVTLNATGIPALQSYGADLITRAAAAWGRAYITTAHFVQFEATCDDGDIKAGDADRDEATQLESAVTAAVYLYEATGGTSYKNFVESKFDEVKPVVNSWWGPYQAPVQYALLRYADMPGVSTTVANAIRNQKAGMNYAFSIDSYNAQTDLYRAQMDDWAHHWGSNQTRANCGSLNMDFVEFNINPGQAAQYREVAEQYLHWFHGTNPLNLSMLSNMYAFGGDACVNEIYHTWFGNNTPYDNALTSPKGPAPGYVTGGPNKDFTYTQLSPPANQPPQKSYKEFNDGWPLNSWEITEPAIYYNAAYILLLSNFAKQTAVPVNEPSAPTILSEKDAFEVFPNPAGDSFFVRFPDARLRTVQVFDAAGVLILERQTTETQLTVELKNAPAGVCRIGVEGVWKQVVKQ